MVYSLFACAFTPTVIVSKYVAQLYTFLPGFELFLWNTLEKNKLIFANEDKWVDEFIDLSQVKEVMLACTVNLWETGKLCVGLRKKAEVVNLSR